MCLFDEDRVVDLPISDEVKLIVDEIHATPTILDWNMRDIRVMLILAAQRLYMFENFPEMISDDVCDETMKIYVPIIDALGFSDITSELGDLALLAPIPPSTQA